MSMYSQGSGVSWLRHLLDTGVGRVHFAGVMGVSVSSLAQALAARGFYVSGSDSSLFGGVSVLEGVDTLTPPEVSVRSADALVYSLAVPEDSVERRVAREYGVPEFCRSELLGAMMLSYERRLGVSGTHGKSTTTAMLASVFSSCGASPTVFCGAEMQGGRRYILGGEKYFIYEACEYRDSFLHFSPTCAILTNIELDHTDYFSGTDALVDSFVRSVAAAERVIVSSDSPLVDCVARRVGDRCVGCGRDSGREYRYLPISSGLEGSKFRLLHRGRDLGEFSTRVQGIHNIANAAIAASAALSEGVEPDAVRRGLECFFGIGGRMELIGHIGVLSVYRDYAHHPTEIRASIETLRASYGRVAVIFKPHTYTRTRDLWDGFVSSLSLADSVGICEIFAARERSIDGVCSEALAASIGNAEFLGDTDVLRYALSIKEGALVLMGAGDLGAALDGIGKIINGG